MKLLKIESEAAKEDLKISSPYMSKDWASPFLVPEVWCRVKNLSWIMDPSPSCTTVDVFIVT